MSTAQEQAEHQLKLARKTADPEQRARLYTRAADNFRAAGDFRKEAEVKYCAWAVRRGPDHIVEP